MCVYVCVCVCVCVRGCVPVKESVHSSSSAPVNRQFKWADPSQTGASEFVWRLWVCACVCVGEESAHSLAIVAAFFLSPRARARPPARRRPPLSLFVLSLWVYLYVFVCMRVCVCACVLLGVSARLSFPWTSVWVFFGRAKG